MSGETPDAFLETQSVHTSRSVCSVKTGDELGLLRLFPQGGAAHGFVFSSAALRVSVARSYSLGALVLPLVEVSLSQGGARTPARITFEVLLPPRQNIQGSGPVTATVDECSIPSNLPHLGGLFR